MIHDARRAPRRHVTDITPVIDTMTDEVIGQLGNLSETGMLLIASGVSQPGESLPLWVIISCYSAIGLGTMFGGWRIVKTMGQRITKLKPVDGFCAETGGAMTLFLATALGIPVSTTHTITGAIVGVGSTRRPASVRWGVAGSIVWAWVLTIPCSALIAAVFWYVGRVVI